MHRKGWDLVGNYVKENLEFFTGKASDAESTTLPALSTWIQDTLSDIPESWIIIDPSIFFFRQFGGILAGVSLTWLPHVAPRNFDPETWYPRNIHTNVIRFSPGLESRRRK